MSIDNLSSKRRSRSSSRDSRASKSSKFSKSQKSEKTTETESLNAYVILIASVAALGGILFGFDTGVISGAMIFIQKEFQLSQWMNGLVVSSVLLGAFLGSSTSVRLADEYGRRRMLIVTAVIFFLGSVFSALAPSEIWLLISRSIVGFGIGVASYVTPLYISEIAPSKYRGSLVSLNQLAITVGIVLSYLVDYYFAPYESWRGMLAVGIVPAVGLLIGMLFLPKSPRWMVLKGWVKQAEHTLMKIRQSDNVQAELRDIEKSVADVRPQSISALFKPMLRPVLFVTLGLAIIQQITGINTIIYYAPTIFQLAGFHAAQTAILATLGVGIANVLFTVISLPLIDRWGRRPLLLLGTSAMMLSLLTLAISFHQGAVNSDSVKWMALGSMLLFIAGFAISLGPIMWLMASELYPLEVRGAGASFTASANWLFNMVVALTFLALIKQLGPSGTFLTYALISVLSLFFIYNFVPETKDISLEKIEENLRKGVKVRYLGK